MRKIKFARIILVIWHSRRVQVRSVVVDVVLKRGEKLFSIHSTM